MVDAEELAGLSGVRVGTELARLCDLAADALANVGPLLRELRARRGLTQEAVALQLGMTGWAVSLVESGARTPTPGHLRAVARWARAAYANGGPR